MVKKFRVKKQAAKLLSVLLVCAVLLAGCVGESDTESESEEALVPIEIETLKYSEIANLLVYAGQVKAKEQVYIMPKTSGKVEAVYQDVGDRVMENQVLFKIDEEDVRKNIRQLEASLAQAQAGVSSAQSTYSSTVGSQQEGNVSRYELAMKNAESALEKSELGLDAVQVTLDNAQIALDNATTTYNNAKVLYDAGVMAQTEFDGVEATYNKAVNDYQSAITGQQTAISTYELAKVAYESAVSDYNLYVGKTAGEASRTAQAGVSTAQAGAQVVQVQLQNARETLNDLNVKSTISGVITERAVEVGGMASATSPAFTIVNMDTVHISVSVSEELINTIKVGDEVSVTIGSIGLTHKGLIKTISPAVNEMTNTYPVEIELDNANGELKPGMFAEVTFKKESNNSTFVLPRNTVIQDVESKYVYVEQNGIAVKKLVETGIDNGKEIEVVNGLSEGDHIIVTGYKNVSEGTKVKVIAPDAKEE